MLMVSLSVHICKCCRWKGHSEVLVTYVNKDKSSFRRGQSSRSRTADADILSQLPTISYDDVDKESPGGDSRREKEFRSSAEGLYMDIPDCTFIQSKGKSDVSADQMYQVDEDGYAKPRNVIGGTTSVLIPEIGPITDCLIGHVDRPVKKPKPTPIPRSRKDGQSSTDNVK
nr:uncharacterized protein LOC129279298 [Lytechinus pictus]